MRLISKFAPALVLRKTGEPARSLGPWILGGCEACVRRAQHPSGWSNRLSPRRPGPLPSFLVATPPGHGTTRKTTKRGMLPVSGRQGRGNSPEATQRDDKPSSVVAESRAETTVPAHRCHQRHCPRGQGCPRFDMSVLSKPPEGIYNRVGNITWHSSPYSVQRLLHVQYLVPCDTGERQAFRGGAHVSHSFSCCWEVEGCSPSSKHCVIHSRPPLQMPAAVLRC